LPEQLDYFYRRPKAARSLGWGHTRAAGPLADGFGVVYAGHDRNDSLPQDSEEGAHNGCIIALCTSASDERLRRHAALLFERG
jgi:hypothetical protein